MSRKPQEPAVPLHWSRSTCPECNGTGVVFVIDQGDTRPIKTRSPDWGKPKSVPCGFCGGDGVISHGDYAEALLDEKLRDDPRRHPIEAYTELKKRALK